MTDKLPKSEVADFLIGVLSGDIPAKKIDTVVDIKIAADIPLPTEERYNRQHNYNGVTFQLDDFIADNEESKILIMKCCEQAIRDYQLLGDSELASEREAWETAKDFLYDDDYLMFWGTWEISPRELLDIVAIDIDYLRCNITKKLEGKQ